MALQASPAPTEIITTFKETIHSLLQRYPEHDSITVFNEVLRLLIQTITKKFGKTFPKELRWCEKLPTIVTPREESLPTENRSMVDPTTRNDAISTPDTSIPERCSMPDDTTQDRAPATQDTSSPESLPIPDNTTQDGACASTTQDTSIPETYPMPDDASLTAKDAIVQELTEQAENFKNWAKDPSSFWNHSTHELKLLELTISERHRSFCEHAAEECMDAMV